MALQISPYVEISEFSPDLEETGWSQDTHRGQTGISNKDIEKVYSSWLRKTLEGFAIFCVATIQIAEFRSVSVDQANLEF